MNDIHSHSELKYKKRWFTDKIKKTVTHHPVTVMTGARQVGKSTLIKNEFPDWEYITFDDFDVLKRAEEEPESLWANSNEIIIDEVQKYPGILERIKIEIDSRSDIRFILSGSANLLLMKHVSESLAGRAIYLKLNPMTLGEIHGWKFWGNISKCFEKGLEREYDSFIISSPPDLHLELFRGGMPRLLEQSEESIISQWFGGYVQTYLERDMRDLSNISALPDFRRLMSALALQSGSLLNQTNLASNLKISQPTVHRYINILETSNLFTRLPSFNVNRKKRLVKSPKALYIDPGLTTFLSGLYSSAEFKENSFTGNLFECLIALHLQTECSLMTPEAKLYFWRTSLGNEVDFVIEWGRKLAAVEVKLSAKVKHDDTKNLRIFMQEYPECAFSLIVYNGDEIKTVGKNILAIPWYML